jgi:hypothetical protein
MTDRPVPPRPACVSQEQWDKVSGGDCSPDDLIAFGAEMQQHYDALVNFTSYVIERVAGS